MIVATSAVRKEIIDWLLEHGIDPMLACHARITIDFPLGDIITLTVERYAINEQGKYYTKDGNIAMEGATTVPLQSFPKVFHGVDEAG